jgi:hypothetical protein
LPATPVAVAGSRASNGSQARCFLLLQNTASGIWTGGLLCLSGGVNFRAGAGVEPRARQQRDEMTICVSFMSADEPAAIRTHQTYCNNLAYEHHIVHAHNIQSEQHCRLFQFETLLHFLVSVPENDLVALMTEDCVVINAIPLHSICLGRDHLLPLIDGVDKPTQEPSEAFQLWRNTPDSRDRLRGLIAMAKISATTLGKGRRHPGLTYVGPGECAPGLVAAKVCNVRIEPDWIGKDNILALTLSDVELYAGTSNVFRAAFFAYINAVQSGESEPRNFAPSEEKFDCSPKAFNSGAPIALVMYYTPNIACFGDIAAECLRRYCETNNYALYVHHSPLPDHPDITGAWIKPFLLREHFDKHEWIFWIDADILILDARQKLEPMLVSRDIALAHDIGPWEFNSGAMGFRCNPQNREILDAACGLIAAVEDRSSTYASGGDQTILNNFLVSLGWRSEMAIDFISFNTPWFFRQENTFMAHYYGMWPQYRAIIMDHDDRGLAQRR